MPNVTEPAGDDLDAVLSAFVRDTGGEKPAAPVATRETPAEATAQPQPKPESEPTPAPESKPSLFGDLRSKYEQKPVDPRDAELADFRDRFAAMTGTVERVELSQAKTRAKEDSNVVIKQAEQLVADSGKFLPEGYAEQYLRNELRLDPDLHDAWSSRWDGPEQAARCERAVHRALQKFEKSLAKLPSPADVQLSYDRDAVSAAVRGASHAPAPPPKPPNVSKISSNREFADYVEKTHGYRPRIDGV